MLDHFAVQQHRNAEDQTNPKPIAKHYFMAGVVNVRSVAGVGNIPPMDGVIHGLMFEHLGIWGVYPVVASGQVRVGVRMVTAVLSVAVSGVYICFFHRTLLIINSIRLKMIHSAMTIVISPASS
jgi:hypothetical protein